MAEVAEDAYNLQPLRRFYRFHAAVYDWTRPFILFGRLRLLKSLSIRPGTRALDVGCGTGWSFPHLAKAGAEIIGVEASPDMRARALRRAARLPKARISLDSRPYGSHEDYQGSFDLVLFSYSLTMIPPYEEVLQRADRDLKPGGQIGVVDFLDALDPFPARALGRSHVQLGRSRLDALSRLFKDHEATIRRAGLWRYFLFRGRSSSKQL